MVGGGNQARHVSFTHSAPPPVAPCRLLPNPPSLLPSSPLPTHSELNTHHIRPPYRPTTSNTPLPIVLILLALLASPPSRLTCASPPTLTRARRKVDPNHTRQVA